MDCKKLDIKNLASIELYCVIAKKKEKLLLFYSDVYGVASLAHTRNHGTNIWQSST